jgi:pimeloyl-ACP methyl ester carboxylesterase
MVNVPIVLVHGYWHGTWCWSLVSQELAAAGMHAVAVDLEGHGLNQRPPASALRQPFELEAFATEPSRVADVTTSSAAADLLARLKTIGRGRPCAVIAHSMGGAVATAAAERAPELFNSLTYVTAFAPVGGISPLEYLQTPEAADSRVLGLLCGDPAVSGAARLNLRSAEARQAIRDALFSDLDEEAADAATNLLSYDAPLAMSLETLTVTRARYGSTPHSYITCRIDNTIPLDLQRRFIAEIDAVSAKPTTVVDLNASHSPFLSRPRELAEAICHVVMATAADHALPAS